MAATILASAMAFIDGTIVTIALPLIRDDLAASFGATQWVVNAYALFLGSLILIGGAAGDRFGRRRIFSIGIAVFALASIACAAAPSAGALIAARAAQGIGAAMLVPQSLAIIAANFPPEARGRAIGLWAGASALTTALGPPLGGLLIDSFGWRSIFWINLPFSLLALWLALAKVRESRDEAQTGPLDWPGAATAILAFGLLTIGLTRFAESGGANGTVLALGAAGLAAGAAFLALERRAQSPLIPLSLFRNQRFVGVNLMTLFLYGALGATLFLLPFDLIERRGLTATQMGLALLPFGLIIGAVSRFSGQWADAVGVRTPILTGTLLVALGSGWLALMFAPFWLGVLAPILVIGFGMGLVVAPLTTAVMNAAPEGKAGAASGINNAASRLAGLFAIVFAGVLTSLVFAGRSEGADFGALPPPSAPARAALEAAFMQAYSAAMWMTFTWCLMAAIIAFYFLREAASAEPR
ncbi:MAG: MFS transporter [Pseudomonadota bacterium]